MFERNEFLLKYYIHIYIMNSFTMVYNLTYRIIDWILARKLPINSETKQ